MFIVHTGVCPAAWHPLPPLGSAAREEAENWGPGRSAHSPGLAWRGPLPSSALPPGAILHSSLAHSCILPASREPPLRALWGRESGRRHPGWRPPGAGVSGGDHSQADGERGPRAGPGLQQLPLLGHPTQRASGVPEPGREVGTQWVSGPVGDTLDPWGLGGQSCRPGPVLSL